MDQTTEAAGQDWPALPLADAVGAGHEPRVILTMGRADQCGLGASRFFAFRVFRMGFGNEPRGQRGVAIMAVPGPNAVLAGYGMDGPKATAWHSMDHVARYLRHGDDARSVILGIDTADETEKALIARVGRGSLAPARLVIADDGKTRAPDWTATAETAAKLLSEGVVQSVSLALLDDDEQLQDCARVTKDGTVHHSDDVPARITDIARVVRRSLRGSTAHAHGRD